MFYFGGVIGLVCVWNCMNNTYLNINTQLSINDFFQRVLPLHLSLYLVLEDVLQPDSSWEQQNGLLPSPTFMQTKCLRTAMTIFLPTFITSLQFHQSCNYLQAYKPSLSFSLGRSHFQDCSKTCIKRSIWLYLGSNISSPIPNQSPICKEKDAISRKG